MDQSPKAIREQIRAAGVLPHVRAMHFGENKITGVIGMLAVVALRKDKRFCEPGLHHLHPGVGRPRTEFRSDNDSLGEGSLQIVINTISGYFEADIDRVNPAPDAVGMVGHTFADVLPPWGKRAWNWFRRKGAAV